MQQQPALLNLTEQQSRLPDASLQQGDFCRRRERRYRNLGAVAANGLDRATFHRLFAERFFFG
jgi:hypothetical protein